METRPENELVDVGNYPKVIDADLAKAKLALHNEVFCHVCHSTDIRKRKMRRLTSPMFIVNALKAIFGAKEYYKCRGCGNGWRR